MQESRKEHLEQQIQRAWDFTFEKLYYSKTSSFYDFLMGNSIEETLDEYPTPEEIKASIPNPCGWGTGMEDSTLNFCPMLEAILARYEITKEPEMQTYFDMVYQGMIQNGTIALEPGFIVRCVSPVDGKSFYMDSSRDQYTNWVYAAHLLLGSELASEEQKQRLREVLVHIAQKAERDIKPEEGGYIHRLDGKPGIVCQMDSANLGPHEFLRLPMFYMAAYEASADKYWLEKYLEIRERLLQWTENSFTVEWIKRVAHGYGRVFGSYQAQYSLRLLYDLEQEEGYRMRYYQLMQNAAEGATEYMKLAYENIDALSEAEPLFKPWRTLPAGEYRMFQGYAYYVPQSYQTSITHKYLRNVSEVVLIQCLCPEYKMPEWEKEMFLEFVERLQFDKATCYWPLLFCDAWWLAKKTGHI